MLHLQDERSNFCNGNRHPPKPSGFVQDLTTQFSSPCPKFRQAVCAHLAHDAPRGQCLPNFLFDVLHRLLRRIHTVPALLSTDLEDLRFIIGGRPQEQARTAIMTRKTRHCAKCESMPSLFTSVAAGSKAGGGASGASVAASMSQPGEAMSSSSSVGSTS